MAATRTTTPSGSRWYDWRGERYWSVTTIINGGLPKRALIYWAANETAGYALDNIDTLKAMLRADDRDGAYDLLKRSPWRKRDKAGEVGTEIHTAVEAYVLGKPMPAWSPLVKPRMVQFERFLADHNPSYEEGAAEAPVFNRTEKYAGTLDAVATIGGVRYIIDVKSGKGVYPEVGLQLAAYRYAEFIGLPDGDERPMPEVDKAAVVHLTDDGYRLIEVRADEHVFRAFLYVRETFRFLEETSKTVLLGDVTADRQEVVA